MDLVRGSLLLAAIGVAACGASSSLGDTGWVDGSSQRLAATGGAFQLQWSKRVVPPLGDAYLPVEHATPAVDPERDRVYVGSSAGSLLALDRNGRVHWRYQPGVSFEAGPTLDRAKAELFAVTEDGTVHKLDAISGRVLWSVPSSAGPTRQPVLLLPDALYLVSDTDQVVALSRDNGDLLWRYRREATSDYHVAGHAGLRLADARLFAAFSDGMVAALDPSDGRVLWERDTALDFPPGEVGRGQRFVDVDTTPALIGDALYVASFSGGLYVLEASNGSVRNHVPDLTGILSLTPLANGDLLVTDASQTLSRVNPESGAAVWRRRITRGTPGVPLVQDRIFFLGESKGGFVARSLSSGAELTRVEAGHGFSATASVESGHGFVLSNGGTLFAFLTH